MPGAEVTKIVTDMDDNSEQKTDAVSFLFDSFVFKIAQSLFAVGKFQTEKEMSKHMKTFFDKKFQPNWHCVVGKNFATQMSYENKTFIFFYVGQTAFLLYKMT
jgi:dynein light chain LC8-type